MFETRVVPAKGVNHNTRSDGIIEIFFSIVLNIIVCCVCSIGSPHEGDSNKYTQYTIFNMKKKITRNYPRYAAMECFTRDSRTSSKQSL